MVQVLELKQYATAEVVRRVATATLLALSGTLVRLAARLEAQEQAAAPETVEFARLDLKGEASGALYVDGRLVGVLTGVERL
jgi:hypothetical protein